MEFIIKYQLDIMMFMCGMCGILAFMTLITKSLPNKTKFILATLEISAMLLLFFDRLSYIYKGDVSDLGYYIVRISNGMVYVFSLVIPYFVTRYLDNILKNEAKLSYTSKLFIAADIAFILGMILLIISQFTGLYYTFDEGNNYHRAPLNTLCYIAPVVILILQEWAIIKYRKKIEKSLMWLMLICIILPPIASIIQIFFYGISLINMTTAFVVCVFYTYALSYLSNAAENARKRELEYYKEAQQKEAMLFEETTEALANAIDAKDKYTRGHSTRVALYSKKIAIEAGLDEKECNQVYFAALLHDIGKIGIRNDIINKKGKLTEEEYNQIKEHSNLGNQILSSIKVAPFLSEGAHYHHERYDGTGYPDGLSGENIPKIARIIAVADAYDAMTSDRSYRTPLEREVVKRELEEGIGTQFDPQFAKIMLKIMEQ